MHSPNSPRSTPPPRSLSGEIRCPADRERRPRSRPPLDWRRIGALQSIATSALGLAVSGALTVLKFMSECRCQGTLLNTCRDSLNRVSPALQDMFDCTAAFSSPYAAVFGLPLTVYAAALYAAALVLALVVAGGGSAAVRAARWLFVLALLDVAATVALFAVSTWILAAWCLFCFCMYFLSASLLAGAAITLRGERSVLPRLAADRRLALHLAGFGLAVVAVQSVPYFARCDEPEAGCMHPVAAPPDTDLVLGDTDPDVLLAVVFDPTCSACAREFHDLEQLVAREPDVGVRFYHYPREPGACGLAGLHVPASTLFAVNGRACELSFAVACIAARPDAVAGDGLAALSAVFATVGQRPASARLAAVVDPFLGDFTRQQLDRCTRDRRSPQAEQIAAHIRFGVDLDVRDTPTVVVAPVRDGSPQWQIAQVLPGRDGDRLHRAIDRARRALVAP